MNVRLVHSVPETTEISGKERMIETLRDLLRETCRLRNAGSPYATLAHSQGYADGYMRSLVDGGIVSDHELLDIIRDVRRGVNGPATRSVSLDDVVSA